MSRPACINFPSRSVAASETKTLGSVKCPANKGKKLLLGYEVWGYGQAAGDKKVEFEVVRQADEGTSGTAAEVVADDPLDQEHIETTAISSPSGEPSYPSDHFIHRRSALHPQGNYPGACRIPFRAGEIIGIRIKAPSGATTASYGCRMFIDDDPG